MILLLRLALRDLWGSRKFSATFVFSLAVGLSGYLALDTLKNSLHKTLGERSKALLGADLAISAKRALSLDEEKNIESVLGKNVRTTHMVEFLTMVASQGGSRLVEIRAWDGDFPFYGRFQRLKNSSLESRSVWVDPEILAQLDLKIGSEIKFAERTFTIQDVVTEDTTSPPGSSFLAPHIYVSKQDIPKSFLSEKGSTLDFIRFIAWKDNRNSEDIAKSLNLLLPDPSIRITTPTDASQQASRLSDYLNDYLELVALAAIVLTAIGSGYLFRSYLKIKVPEIATLTALGLSRLRCLAVFSIQAVLLIITANIFSTLLAMALLPIVSLSFKDILQFQIPLNFSIQSFFYAFGISIFTTFGICLPNLLRILRIRPQQLFSESVDSEIDPPKTSLWLYTPGFLSFCGFSFLVSHSFYVGGFFILGVSVGAALISGFCFLSFGLLSKIGSRVNIAGRLAIRNLTRSRASSFAYVVALGLATLVGSLIPQIQKSIQAELDMPSKGRPNLFLFDIQEEQLPDLKEQARKLGAEVENLSPLVRARLEKVNGEVFEKRTSAKVLTREEEQEARFRNRGFNLTIRDHLSDSEKLETGVAFSATQSKELSEISIEKRFAERLNLHIGDKLEFDVQGLKVSGKVVNFRTVKWMSFQPNFFVVFPTGSLLDIAAKSYLASFSGLNFNQKILVQREITKQFANISLVDIDQTISRILSVAEEMGFALKVMSVFVFIVSLVVIAAVVQHQTRERRRDFDLLKVVGGSQRLILSLANCEFLILNFIATTGGILLSIGCAWLLCRGAMNLAFELNPSLFFIWLAGLILPFLTASQLVKKQLLSKPRI